MFPFCHIVAASELLLCFFLLLLLFCYLRFGICCVCDVCLVFTNFSFCLLTFVLRFTQSLQICIFQCKHLRCITILNEKTTVLRVAIDWYKTIVRQFPIECQRKWENHLNKIFTKYYMHWNVPDVGVGLNLVQYLRLFKFTCNISSKSKYISLPVFFFYGKQSQ